MYQHRMGIGRNLLVVFCHYGVRAIERVLK
jgi:hypothetical protein